MAQRSVEGGCYCGAIRYRIEGEPLLSGICHCRSCRRTSSAPILPFLTFLDSQVQVLRGKPVEFNSSPGVTRSFCGKCGSPLTYRHSQYVDKVDVFTCSLDDPEIFPPTFHVWFSHKPKWLRVADGLPVYDNDRSGEPRTLDR